jgi:protein-S-isoprenylcysteine O-methyltransferase Ste14
LGWVLIITGALLALRVLQTFGLDNLTMLYVYFPEEGRFVDHEIYDILRHPAYGAAQRIALGLALLDGTWFALSCALLFMLGLRGWVRLVEEKELLERFGRSYAEYRQRVPAFWPRLRDLGRFYKFLAARR